MMDPTSFVQAYHATREVHEDYLRERGQRTDDKVSAVTEHARWTRPITLLAALLASVAGERRLATTLRHHA